MKTLPLSEAKAHLSKIVAEVASRDERVTITRNGRPAAMIVSPEEIEGMEATLELLSDSVAMRGIRRGLRQLEQGRILSQSEVEDLFDLRPGEARSTAGRGRGRKTVGPRRGRRR